jgi:prepilin-type N-terminal cleavage/methylation domain-containing protein
MNKNKRKGFTLVEIMIVVLIIGILLAIAIPNFIKARQNSRLQTIVANLRQIENAKEQCAMDKGLANGATTGCAQADLTDATNGYMKAWPAGPVPGTYVVNAIGSAPTFGGKNIDTWKADASGL